jgi:hypothetical protein
LALNQQYNTTGIVLSSLMFWKAGSIKITYFEPNDIGGGGDNDHDQSYDNNDND